MLTPIAKSWPSQWCLDANDLAIQVHGGYGYTREYDVEQLYRDNRLNPIHEGTHGIQALDLLGRKVDDGGRRRARRARRTPCGHGRPRRSAAGGEAADTGRRAATPRSTGCVDGDRARSTPPTTRRRGTAGQRLALPGGGRAHRDRLDVARAVPRRRRPRRRLPRGQAAAARYFFRYELPRTGPQLDLLASLDRTTVDTDPQWL